MWQNSEKWAGTNHILYVYALGPSQLLSLRQDFLLSDEKVEPSSVFTPTDIVDPSAPKVALYKACATWRLVEPLGLGQDSETPILRPAGAAHPDEGHRETRKVRPNYFL